MSVPRVVAFALSVAVTFTPAVVGACAALLCAPVEGGAGLVAAQGHDGHHQAPAVADPSGEHAHHASTHGGGHSEVSGAESARTRAAAIRLQVRTWPEDDCCANAGSLAVAAIPGANRFDIATHADAVVRVPRSVAGSGIAHPQHPPAIPIETPRPSVPAPLVLRI